MEPIETTTDDKSGHTNKPDTENTVEMDQTNNSDADVTANIDEGEEEKFAVESEMVKTETSDVTNKDTSSELGGQEVQTEDECLNEEVHDPVDNRKESNKADLCLEDKIDKAKTVVRESSNEDEHTTMEVDHVPKTNEILDKPMDEENANEADSESAKKDCTDKSDQINENHQECSLADGSTLENDDNQTENQNENTDNEQNSAAASHVDEALDEDDSKKLEGVAVQLSENSIGSEEADDTENIGGNTDEESERPKLIQVNIVS